MNPKLYSNLNSSWLSTSKTIFGREIGELKDFETFLSEGVIALSAKSAFSKKPVFLASDQYEKNARFFNFSEEAAKASELSKPFDINSIKDMDSIVEAAGDRFAYAGNKTFGNCADIGHSDMVFDCSSAFHCATLSESKMCAHCFSVRNSENAFGGVSFGYCTSTIRCFYCYELRRVFESVLMGTSSDCYYCYNVMNANDCMFCFNSYNKRNCIANIQLDKPKYAELKAKLVSEMADYLESKKRLPFSMLDCLGAEK